MSRKIIDSFKKEVVEAAVEATAPTFTSGIPGVDKSKGIDDLLLEGLYQIQRLLSCVKRDIDTGSPERDTVQTLRDCMSMLHELRKQEQALLGKLSDEELEKLKDKDAL